MSAFCPECPDHEGCMQGIPCEVAKSLPTINEETLAKAKKPMEGDDADGKGSAVPPVDSEDLAGTLSRWWASKAAGEARTVVPKAVEYGGAHRASDLTDLGRTMADLMGHDRFMADEDLQELAVFFYIEGKLGRWKAALLEGRRVSDDTIYDIGIYIKMVQRIREAGGWPV